MAKLSTILTGMRNHEPDAFVLAQDRLENPKVCQANKDRILAVWHEVYGTATPQVTPEPEPVVAQASTAHEIVEGLERLAREMAKARLEQAVAAASDGDRVRTRIRESRKLDAWTDEAFADIVGALQAA